MRTKGGLAEDHEGVSRGEGVPSEVTRLPSVPPFRDLPSVPLFRAPFRPLSGTPFLNPHETLFRTPFSDPLLDLLPDPHSWLPFMTPPQPRTPIRDPSKESELIIFKYKKKFLFFFSSILFIFNFGFGVLFALKNDFIWVIKGIESFRISHFIISYCI